MGRLFQAAMGATPVFYTGGTVAAVTGGTEIQFTAAHGLSAGQGVTFLDEMRFVAAVQDADDDVPECAVQQHSSGGVDVRDRPLRTSWRRRSGA